MHCSTQGQLMEPHKYAALQKLDDPNEICAYEAIPSPRLLQAEHVCEAVGPGSPGWRGGAYHQGGAGPLSLTGTQASNTPALQGMCVVGNVPWPP